jgi:hypothetical protein
MVSWLVSISAEAEPRITLAVLLDMVIVPPPLSVTFAAPIDRSVKLPVEFIEIVPALLIVLPLTLSVVPLLKLKASVLDPRVRLAVTAPLIFSVTVEPAVLMHELVLLVGMPALQLPATFQSPVAPAVQLVSHCANAESGHKNSTSNATRKICLARLLFANSCFTPEDNVSMSVAPDTGNLRFL